MHNLYMCISNNYNVNTDSNLDLI